MGTLAISFFNLVIAGFVLALIPLYRHRMQSIKWPIAARLILVFMLWSLVTVYWTFAGSRSTAFFYLVSTSLDILVVFILAKLGEIDIIATSSLRGIILGTLVVAVVALAAGETSGGYRMGNAEFLHPTTIASQMAIAILCSLYFLGQKRPDTRKRIIWCAIAIILVFTLLRSLGKASIIGCFVASAVYLLRLRLRGRETVVVLVLLAGVVALSYGLLSEYLGEYLYNTQGGEALESISGRTYIWDQTWEMIGKNPIWGYGFLSFRDYGPQIADVRLVHAHNELLNIWFSLGAVGVILTFLIYLTYYFQVRYSSRLFTLRSQADLGLALLVYSLVRGITEASVTGLVYPLPLMLLMLAWMTRESQGAPMEDFSAIHDCAKT